MNRVNATVFVVDDDPGVRKSVQMVMESAGLWTELYGSAEEFLEAQTGGECGCLLLDLRLPGMGGLELLAALKSQRRAMPVIVITGYGDIPAAVQSMRLGAADFLEKPIDHHALVEKVKAAIAASMAKGRMQMEIEDAHGRLRMLTDRERELLVALMVGKSSKQMAAEMGISMRTVENHRSRMLAKTGAENTADLVRMGMLAGLAWAGGTMGPAMPLA
ncbi:MAG TPA: response regulator [Tepidisphaeraceae bacterium]|nr:response regulator [Tepidisphaeraceae bacterium]